MVGVQLNAHQRKLKMIKKFKQHLHIPDFEPKNHEYHTNNGTIIDSVTQILKTELDTYNYSNANNAALRGTHIHIACELWDKNDLNEETLDPIIKPYLEQYKLALKNEGIEILQNELRRYSEKYLFAGTIDKVAKLKKVKNILIDIKSGVFEKWHFIQLGAYGELIRPEFKIDEYYDLYLKPDSYNFVKQDGKKGFSYFLAIMASHNIKKNLGYLKTRR